MMDVARRLFGGARPDVNETTPAGVLHRGQHRPQQEDLAHRVRLEGFAVDIHIVDVGEIAGSLVLGLTDHDQRRADLGAHLTHGVFELLGPADVCAHAHRVAAVAADRVDCRVDVGFRPREYRDPAALGGKHFGDFEADSLAAADDQRRACQRFGSPRVGLALAADVHARVDLEHAAGEGASRIARSGRGWCC